MTSRETDTGGARTETPQETVARLSLEQKSALLSGADFWHTKTVPGVETIMLTDGPHGVRKQSASADHVGLADSEPATCFPPAAALGSSFDPALLERIGKALGEEARAQDVRVLLGPGINIKRSPLCGRNFEYLSEDPLVSGVLAAALVRGIQSRGVAASLKHFAVNNQETERLRISADVDDRPLREIYLRGFERVVKGARPGTVMCAYNRINGVHASQNPWLLTQVLRGEWGFGGLVVSDWGAVEDRVSALAAGLDLEMPASTRDTDAEIVDAVREGALDESLVDAAAQRVVALVQSTRPRSGTSGTFDAEAHHALAREAAARSVVLLRNDPPAGGEEPLLPLNGTERIAVIGEFARTPRYQGAGSSQVNPTRLDSALEAIRETCADTVFAPGFSLDRGSREDAARLRAQAVDAARNADTVLLFLGLPAESESEGFDRSDIELPGDQLALLEAVAEANPRLGLVLSNGGVVRLAHLVPRAPALLEGWLLGQAGGGALADVLFGRVNPSGRLAETVPLRLEDTPAHLDFPGENGHVRYGEGLFVGYRWYDARDIAVSFPFGHGLSYTVFGYSGLSVSADEAGLTVRVTVTNAGQRAGREIVQVYTGVPGSAVARAPRELRAFAAVDLAAGESQEIALGVPRADLAHWDIGAGAWVVEGGDHLVEVGASSRDIRLRTVIGIDGDALARPITAGSTIDEAFGDPEVRAVADEVFGPALLEDEELAMLGSFPLGRLASMPDLGFDWDQLEEFLARLGRASRRR